MANFSKHLFITLAVALALVSPTLAHEKLIDGAVSAVLYYTPHHAPEATANTIVNFDFTQNSPAFDFAHCNCDFTIGYDSETIFHGNISDKSVIVSNGIASFPYTFSETGNYVVGVTGVQNGKPFSLSYAQAVVGLGEAAAAPEHTQGMAMSGNSGMAHGMAMYGHEPLMLAEMALMGLAPILAGVLILRVRIKERKLQNA